MTNLLRKMGLTVRNAGIFALRLFTPLEISKTQKKKSQSLTGFTPLDKILYLTGFILAGLVLAPPGAGVGHAAEFQVVDDLTVPNGNVGVGTTAPARKLDVIGTSGVGIGTSAAGDVLVVSTVGNVGIGTTSPLQKLHVQGLCVTGDTLVKIVPAEAVSAKGLIAHSSLLIEKRIVDVQMGDHLLSLNEATGNVEPHKIKGLLDMGVRPVFKLTTEDDKTITTTGNHPYLVKGVVNEEEREEVARLRIAHLAETREVNPAYLQEEYEFSDPRVIWRLNSFVEQNEDEINQQYQNGEDIKKSSHHTLPLSFDDPKKNNQGEYSRQKIKSQKTHYVTDSIFDSFAAMMRNSIAMAIPIENVNHGILSAAPGTNTPTTSDANIIFAPSRKKSDTVFSSSLVNIQEHSNTEEHFVKEKIVAQWLKVIYLQEGDEIAVYNEQRPMTNDPYVLWTRIKSIEFVGYEQVYDIEVEGTHNFIANGIVAHNTYMSTNVGIGTTAPARALDVVGTSGVGIGTSAAGDVFIISSAGNVGIGTAAPLNKLDVAGKLRVAETAYFDAEYDNGSKTGAFTVDWNNGNKQKVTITGTSLAVTFTAPAGPCNVILKIVQGDGSDTLSWTTVPKWPSGTTPTLTTASGATDIISLYYDGTNYYGVASLNFQ